jgi:hypothetical protein
MKHTKTILVALTILIIGATVRADAPDAGQKLLSAESLEKRYPIGTSVVPAEIVSNRTASMASSGSEWFWPGKSIWKIRSACHKKDKHEL